MKLNSDGASKGNPGPAGGGGVFRDDSGAFVRAYTFKCGYCSALKAELNAVLYGLQAGERMGLTKLVIEVDSSEVAAIFNSDTSSFHAHHHLIEKGRHLIQNTRWDVRVCKIRRQENKVADRLANWALNLLIPFTEYSHPPECISGLLSEDTPM